MKHLKTWLAACCVFVVLQPGCATQTRLGQVPQSAYQTPRELLLDGRQTDFGPGIRKTALSLRGDTDVATVRNIHFWIVHNTARGGRRHFLQRDARQLYHDRTLSGCIDIATLFASFVRSLAIPAVFVHSVHIGWAHTAKNTTGPFKGKYRGHTFLELYLDGAWFLLDPTAGILWQGYDPTDPFLPDDYVVQFKGADMWAFGIKGSSALHESMLDFALDFDAKAYQKPKCRQIKD